MISTLPPENAAEACNGKFSAFFRTPGNFYKAESRDRLKVTCEDFNISCAIGTYSEEVTVQSKKNNSFLGQCYFSKTTSIVFQGWFRSRYLSNRQYNFAKKIQSRRRFFFVLPRRAKMCNRGLSLHDLQLLVKCCGRHRPK